MEDYSTLEEQVVAQPVKVFFVCADGSLCSSREDALGWDAD
jgi:hypothetical protein